MQEESIQISNEERKRLTESGKKIHAICKFIEKNEVGFNQVRVVKFNDFLISRGHINEEYQIRFSQEDLSNAKRRGANISKNKVSKILKSLHQISIFRGFKINKIDSKDNFIYIHYNKDYSKKIEFFKSVNIDVQSLKENGLIKIVNQEPSSEIGETIQEAYEIRILQSCLYGWENNWEDKIKKGILKGNLRKVKFLLAQTFSQTAINRAHTINIGSPNPIASFNQRVIAIVNQIINSFNKINTEIDANLKREISFEIKLYYNSSPLSMYQLLDKEGKNIDCFFGVFWEHKSSRIGPHFKITSPYGNLINFIDDHFNKVWNNDYQGDPLLDWHLVNGLKKNLSIISQDSTSKTFSLLEHSYLMRHFSNYHNRKPNWLRFRCYYHNKLNERREFLMGIDLDLQKAKITDTQRENTYYGLAFKLGRSCSIIVHTRKQVSPSRIIYINFYLRTERLESQKKVMFGIYNNCDYSNGFPYAQLMVIKPVTHKKNSDDEESVLSKEFEENAPSIKEKKIDIEYEEYSLTDETKNKGSYIFTFDSKNQDVFYERLKKEISFAKHEIFFLGHGPNHFPVDNLNLMRSYFNSHKLLIRTHNVKIRRILLKSEVDQEFIEILKGIKRDEEISKNYHLYLSKIDIPIITDMVLVDPDEDISTAILTYTITNDISHITHPVKMEVIKDKKKIIKSFHRTFRDYLGLKEEGFITELLTIEDIEKHLVSSVYQ